MKIKLIAFLTALLFIIAIGFGFHPLTISTVETPINTFNWHGVDWTVELKNGEVIDSNDLSSFQKLK